MTFRLERQAPGKMLTKFYVRDSKNAICGTINVPNEDASDFESYWRAPAPPLPKNASAKAGRSKQVSAMVAAARKPSRQAILRGC